MPNVKTFAKVAIPTVAALAMFGAAAPANAYPIPGPSGGGGSDLVEVVAQPATFIGSNGFEITNVADRSSGSDEQLSATIPAGTRFVVDSNNFANAAAGDYAGYTVTLWTINGHRNVVLTLTTAMAPGESRDVSLGQLQATIGTTFDLRLDAVANQPAVTQAALAATEGADVADSQYTKNNAAGLTCLAAAAPAASACSASDGMNAPL
ncbi:hypothetical protein [Luteipulveratus mongoliensis]|uniref:Uncharacterized protein n=1 Tax=Luteipulveratus mongoliensis TaxID=571913 RepID=A0A0K1JF17_9MICO|nr:hypothetical protein [Luteipulveratus mongoliensis]AKU15183.1 hypothetical protein VV02_03760 [Luteipulveratus mongoliensis]